MKQVFKAIDLPPVWLALFAGAGWLLAAGSPLGGFASEGATNIAKGLAILSSAITVWAAVTMVYADTPVIPRNDATKLVTSGPFRFSRNPIYLADLGFLTAFGVWIGSIWPIILVVPFALLLTRRFIEDEEARLERIFGDAYTDWASQVRRWV